LLFNVLYTAKERIWLGDKLTVFSTQEIVSTFRRPGGWKTRWAWAVYSIWYAYIIWFCVVNLPSFLQLYL